jgi:hypothetical protein
MVTGSNNVTHNPIKAIPTRLGWSQTLFLEDAYREGLEKLVIVGKL